MIEKNITQVKQFISLTLCNTIQYARKKAKKVFIANAGVSHSCAYGNNLYDNI